MAKANSMGSSTQTKPHPDFPLTFNKASRYWVKKILGTVHRFGPRDADPQTALDEYLRVRDDLQAGRKPTAKTDGVTVLHACNHFLTDRENRVVAKELTQRSWNEYKSCCELVVKEFGPNRLLTDLRPDDFGALRAKLSKKWGPTTVGNTVQRIRVWVNYLWQAGLIETPLRIGPSFKRPSKKVMRLHRQSKDAKLFTAAEIQALLAIASTEMRAMLLLGINCALGNRDCGKLSTKHVNSEWLDYPRPKTGIKRRCKLWPETLEALADVTAKRKPPANAEYADLIFVTRYGQPWYREDGSDDPIAKEMRKLLDGIGIDRKGVGFYALRHTFKTIADASKDFAAVEHVMGHELDAMAATYREGIGDDRLAAVADHVHAWLFGAEGVNNG